MKKNYVQGVVDYFESTHWINFLENHLVHSDEEVYHAHIYCDTSIHPESMKKIIFAYFASIGHPLTRRIDPVSPHPGQAGLHSIYPRGMAHFDMFTRYNENVVLEEMPCDAPEAEHGQNALSWGKKYQDW